MRAIRWASRFPCRASCSTRRVITPCYCWRHRVRAFHVLLTKCNPPQAYDLLRLLLRRAELSTTMQDDGSSNSTPTHQILLWLELSQRTLSWTLLAVDQPAVKHTDHSSGLLSICAQLMALSFFRLPSFARALIDALQVWRWCAGTLSQTSSVVGRLKTRPCSLPTLACPSKWGTSRL
eukprot:scaffold6580_cov29-Tisochrysis_lutea.AAC.5